MTEQDSKAHQRRPVRSPAAEDCCGLPGCGNTFPIDVIDGWPHFIFVGQGEDRHRVRFCSEEHQQLFEEAATKQNAA